MFCPRCKQVLRKVIFGFACGCAVLTGHAEEPPQSKRHFNHAQIQQTAVTSSSSSVTLQGVVAFASVAGEVKSTDPSSGP
jgi:hypothetical protein